jgi:hypothetical protein
VTRAEVAQGLRERFTRASTEGDDDRPPPPVGTGEGLEELGETLLLLVSKVANRLLRRRTRADWEMTEAEAASISAPAVRMLRRRLNIGADLSDATDVGRGGNGIVSYVFRVLDGEAPDRAAASWRAANDQARAQAQRPVELGAEEAIPAPVRPAPAHLRPEPVEADGFASVGRPEAEPAPAGAAPTQGPTKSFFDGFADV